MRYISLLSSSVHSHRPSYFAAQELNSTHFTGLYAGTGSTSIKVNGCLCGEYEQMFGECSQFLRGRHEAITGFCQADKIKVKKVCLAPAKSNVTQWRPKTSSLFFVSLEWPLYLPCIISDCTPVWTEQPFQSQTLLNPTCLSKHLRGSWGPFVRSPKWKSQTWQNEEFPSIKGLFQQRRSLKQEPGGDVAVWKCKSWLILHWKCFSWHLHRPDCLVKS